MLVGTRTQKRKEEQRTLGNRMKRRRLLLEAAQEAKQFTEGIRLNQDPADAIQEILDNMMMAYRYAVEQMFTLDETEYFVETITGAVPHHWIREQERLALQVTHVASKAAHMGLAERQVRLREQQAAIFASVVDTVLLHMGMSVNDRRKAHELISAQLDAIEGQETEVPALPAPAKAAA